MSDINIQMSEPEESIIDYAKSLQDLISYFDEESVKIQEGKRSATIEFMMLGYGIDFIMFAKSVANLDLDFGEESIPAFDAILEALHNSFSNQQPTQEQFADLAKKATGFLCMVIAKNISCKFFSSNVGFGVEIKDNQVYVMNRIMRRLQNGQEDEVVSYYHYLKTL